MAWAQFDRLQRAVLESDLDALPTFRRWVLSLARLAVQTATEFRRDRGFERAATLSFVSILSLIPLAILFFSFTNLVGVSNEIVAYAKSHLFPLAAPDFTEQLSVWIDEYLVQQQAFKDSFASVMGLAAVVALVPAALGVFVTAEKAFQRIWNHRGSRTFVQRFATFWIVLTTSPFILIASTWLLEYFQKDGGWIDRMTLAHGYGYLDVTNGLLTVGVRLLYGVLVPVFVAYVAFTLLYIYLPAASVRLRSACVGGFVAAVAWEVVRRSFFLYVERTDSLYADLATIPLALVWLYVNWLIVLVGCEVTYVHQGGLRPRGEAEERWSSSPLAAGFAYLEVVGRAFSRGEAVPSFDRVVETTGLGRTELDAAAGALVRDGILVPIAAGESRYGLACALETISLDRVKRALCRDDAALRSALCPASGVEASAEGDLAPSRMVLERAADAFSDVLSTRTLADVVSTDASTAVAPASEPGISREKRGA